MISNFKKIQYSLLGILTTTLSYAGAYSLYTEGNGSAVGNFAAGIAAEAADASTGWYNPAGLAFLHQDQALLGGVGILPNNKLYCGTGTYTTENPLDPDSPFVYSESFDALYGANNALVPSFHLAHPLGPKATAGFSVVVPFGLSTNWDAASPVRYEATYTKLLTIDASPELGAALTEHLNVGLGLDFEYAKVTFNTVIGSPATLNALDLPPTALDSLSYNQGTSFGMGFHAGVLLHLNDHHSRLGVNYQSAINHQFYGYSQLTGRLADPALNVYDPLPADLNTIAINNNLFSEPISFPNTTTLSGYQDVNEKLALLASAVYTTWGSFRNITLYGVEAVTADLLTGEVQQVPITAITEENYRNTWRMALGANYKLKDNFMLRLGTGYEQTPITQAERDARLPDTDRWAASIGAHYQVKPQIGIDGGYTHLFFKNGTINKTSPLLTNQFQLSSLTRAHANLVGAQIVWTMD